MSYVYVDNNTFSLNIAAKSQRLYLSIEEDDTTSIISLEQAIDPLIHLLPNISEKALLAKLNCKNPPDGLSCDESASIYLYSMKCQPYNECLNYVLNNHNQQMLLTPWICYLRLLYTALNRLPSTSVIFYQEMKSDFVENYLKRKVFVSWGFTSCSLSTRLFKSEQLSNQREKRTIFELQCFNAKYIQRHSSIEFDNEILLLPTQFQFIGYLDRKNDLDIIKFREIDPSFPLIQFISIPNTSNSITSSQKSILTKYRNPELEKFISSYHSHSEIDLSYEKLTVEDMSIIIEQAIVGKQCTKLIFNNSPISIKCLSTLLSALPNNITLKELYLNNTGIDDEGIRILTQTLALNNCSIEKLSLGGNHITNESVKYLMEMFKTNTKLKNLHLNPHLIKKRKMNQLIDAVTFNNTKILIT